MLLSQTLSCKLARFVDSFTLMFVFEKSTVRKDVCTMLTATLSELTLIADARESRRLEAVRSIVVGAARSVTLINAVYDNGE